MSNVFLCTAFPVLSLCLCMKVFIVGVPWHDLFALILGTGKQNGVAKLLQDDYPWLVHVACAAHRLALACRDATEEVPYMKTFRDHLQQLHLYFHNSANRTAVLTAASEVLGLKDLKVKEVKDTRWLSQHQAIQTLQRHLPAVLAALAEEIQQNKCPTAKGLYAFCSTFRFVAAVYLQADVLPHLACLSKVFQREMVNFLAIKEQVPITMAALRVIKDAGNQQPPGSFLAQLHQDLDNPAYLGGFNIASHEEERDRRGSVGLQDGEDFWSRFQRQVMEPYLDGLLRSLERRFENLDILGAFHVFGAATESDTRNAEYLRILSRKFLTQQPQNVALQEWSSFKLHVLHGAFKNMDQLNILKTLASQHDEWCQLYPSLSKLAAIALTVPVSSVNCERDFSTMNRVSITHCYLKPI
ncbi:hypothetical protein ACEWY4_024579 [Coilia grayii]|uniref:HAT C-terminal dimerisation domain-containing protein n=2 Tax=Coilia grayii TaxID=363190 RepID=A0ABD1IX54_9TELE